MPVEIIEVLRDVGSHNTTLVTFTRDGETFKFTAGSHVGESRIRTLAETLNFTEKGTD